MKKILSAFLIILLMGCSNDDEIKNEAIEKPIPEGSKKVDIIFDEAYDFTGLMNSRRKYRLF